MTLQEHYESKTLIFYVNGQKIVEKNPDPEETLIQYLRRKLLLTGTKLACGQGACGSCTVMVSRYDRKAKQIRHAAVVSCLVPVCSLHGLAVTTVEGVGSVNTKLHPIQEQLVKAHGTQCGFCTPGFIMSMYTLLRNNPKPSMKEVQRAIKGNLCRCTGYRPILDGFKPFTKDYCPMGDKCCKRTSTITDIDAETKTLYMTSENLQELIFPNELQLYDVLDRQSLVFNSQSVTWFRPISLKQLLYLKSLYPGSKIVSGNTTLGLERQHKNKLYPVLLSVSHIAEMNDITIMEAGIKFGAAVTLSTIEEYIQDFLVTNHTDHRHRSLNVFIHMLQEFAALQLKNMVTIGGSVASAWRNCDVTPLLCAFGATVDLASYGRAPTSVIVDQHFFKGQGCTVIADNEVIVSITLPYLNQDQYGYSIKQARCDFDTAIVNTSALVTYDEETNTIKKMEVYFGNILPSVFFASNLSEGLRGRFCEKTLTIDALKYLQEDFMVIDKLRTERLNANIKSLTEASIWKLIMQIICDVLGEEVIPVDEREAIYPLDTGYIESTQIYEEVGGDQSENDAVGRPIVHRSARQQATGEALYVDDMSQYENELHLSFVTSTYGHARILGIDISEAVKIVGVVDVLTYKDIPGKNQYGLFVPDELVFAVDEVTFYGQIVAAVVAIRQNIAERAAKLVEVAYEPLPCITTIQEAIEANSYIGEYKIVNFGDVQLGFQEADQIVEGEIEVGGQEHFYMETTLALAVPLKEDNELKIYAPVQDANKFQETVASVLDIQRNKVQLCVKRIGGAFGGKATKYLVTLPVALAAHKLKKPVRCVLDRDTDMQITGGRHPALAKYKIGVKKSGLLTALELKVYINAGCTTDVSPAILAVLLFEYDNCYRIPHVHLEGRACKTNLPSNTGMRGFGHPQAHCIVETWIQHVAETLGLDPVQVRECNMYRPGDDFPFDGTSETYTSDRTWNELKLKSNFKARNKEMHKFNRMNKYRKRGLHIGPLKYGLHHSAAFLYQASALVNIYIDGSVLIHHGGVEMGQGVHTLIMQVASRALGIPVENIHINGTYTDVIPNASFSGGSSTSLSNGTAVMDACKQLKDRLKPYIMGNPEGTWTDWVTAAYFDRVSLSATGFYRLDMPNLGYNWKTGKGRAWCYYTSGAACTEVEVDILTGQHVVRRVDIVMDVGKSLNPAIDIGQIEGGFLQGYGLYAMEEIKFDKNGHLISKNAMGYKIPRVTNVPRQFNVTLLKDSENPYAVYSAKGIGEPPLLLAVTVALAIREAMKAYRKDINQNDYFTLKYPVTPDQVRAHCPMQADRHTDTQTTRQTNIHVERRRDNAMSGCNH